MELLFNRGILGWRVLVYDGGQNKYFKAPTGVRLKIPARGVWHHLWTSAKTWVRTRSERNGTTLFWTIAMATWKSPMVLTTRMPLSQGRRMCTGFLPTLRHFNLQRGVSNTAHRLLLVPDSVSSLFLKTHLPPLLIILLFLVVFDHHHAIVIVTSINQVAYCTQASVLLRRLQVKQPLNT
jgi:hypothetical protein